MSVPVEKYLNRFNGIVLDHGSTALAVTYMGFGIKIPINLGLRISNIVVLIIRCFMSSESNLLLCCTGIAH